MKEGSVSKAAALLGRSPPTVSVALSQLRAALQDPLFVRVGGALQPTARAASLAGPLEVLYEQLEGVFATDSFTPASSQRKFVIASSDILTDILGPRMVKALRKNAPDMSLQFVDIGRTLTQSMAAREIDFALLPKFAVTDLAPAPLKFLELEAGQRLVVLMGCDHPLAGRKSVRADELAAFKKIVFRSDPILLEGRKPDPNNLLNLPASTVVVSQYLPIPRLLEGTDLISVVPKPVADAAARHGDFVSVDVAPSQTLCMGIAWSPVFDRDPAHKWFRETIA